ncbi:MAG: hypothetical protein P4L85_01905 [Paludisphaera borealis]|uniref:hypothetical protein n=1 Tax=Paludisphaera borealis TaxID=1387353 RepID=UPI0028465C22|nr:hypothetical protein [Paludisphaera borealis]MDR3618075.1 hypothetical protein [Paludisphaera borealis]
MFYRKLLWFGAGLALVAAGLSVSARGTFQQAPQAQVMAAAVPASHATLSPDQFTLSFNTSLAA